MTTSSPTIPASDRLDDLTSPVVATAAVDDEPPAGNQRVFTGSRHMIIAIACAAYSLFHLLVMNVYPLETWTYRLLHLGGGLALGFLLFGAYGLDPEKEDESGHSLSKPLLFAAGAGILYGALAIAVIWGNWWLRGEALPPAWTIGTFGIPLTVGTALAVVHGWIAKDRRPGIWSAVMTRK